MRLETLTAQDVMTTAVITLKEGDTVSDADAEMHLADIRHLPVVDKHGHLVGIVSNRDLMRALARARGKAVKVAEVMTRKVRTIRPDTPIRQATSLMLQHKIGALPVVGDEEELVGIVTETDLLRIAHRAAGGQRTDWPPDAVI